MKKTQKNSQPLIQKYFLHLEDYQISCININKGSEDPPVFSIEIVGDILENLICIDFEDFEKMNKFFQNALNDTAKIPEYFLRLKDCIIKVKKTYRNFSPVFVVKINSVLMKNSACFDLKDFIKINRFFKQILDKIKQ